MIDVNTIAELIYTEYCKEVGGKAFNGDLLPSWSDFIKDPSKEKQCLGWIAAADKVMKFLLD